MLVEIPKYHQPKSFRGVVYSIIGTDGKVLTELSQQFDRCVIGCDPFIFRNSDDTIWRTITFECIDDIKNTIDDVVSVLQSMNNFKIEINYFDGANKLLFRRSMNVSKLCEVQYPSMNRVNPGPINMLTQHLVFLYKDVKNIGA